MFEEYIEKAVPEERRRAFALDCVLSLIGEQGRELMEGKSWGAERIVERAKVFEVYLAGKTEK